jgi:dTDP-4-dehydrorhamnose reductase
MRWLLYGSTGWIGGQVKNILVNAGHTVIDAQSRADQFLTTQQEIKTIAPDRVIATIGRTSGPTCGNIDYLEHPSKLPENLRDNLQGPLTLASICEDLKIHFTYLGTGCIFEYNSTHPMGSDLGFTEDDPPNFFGSQYSVVKGTTDQLIRRYKTTLNARIRMPISDHHHPRNFVTKITRYPKVISVPNSMTVLPQLLPIMIDMAEKSLVGTINLVNPGAISHAEILDLYREYVDPSFTYHVMPLDELPQHTVGRRSNNYLDTHRLEAIYPYVLPIKDAVKAIFEGGRY